MQLKSNSFTTCINKFENFAKLAKWFNTNKYKSQNSAQKYPLGDVLQRVDGAGLHAVDTAVVDMEESAHHVLI